jgi:hypothetical protein
VAGLRIADRRMIHLIQKWLQAGVLEDGVLTVSDTALCTPLPP